MPGRPWTVEERDLIRNVPHGQIVAVAKRIGRTYKATVQQRMYLRLSRWRPDWRPEEDAFIDAAVAAGVSIGAAARLLGRSAEHARRRYAERHDGGQAERRLERELADCVENRII